MNFSILPSAVKVFFIIHASIYTYKKLLNILPSKRTNLFTFIFSFATTPIVCIIHIQFPLYTILSMSLFVIAYCFFQFDNNFPQTLSITILSIGSNYALFALTSLIAFPIGYFVASFELPKFLNQVIILFPAGLLQLFLLYFLFPTKRFREGIPNLRNKFVGDTGVFIGGLLILLSSVFFINSSIHPVFDLLLISFTIALGIIIWLWWQKTIHTDYINKAHTQQIDILESTLQERDAELERLSKIIHKDNKLLAALELSTRELLLDTPSDKATTLLQELSRFSKERSETLHAYETHQVVLPETGLFSVDTIIRYLYQRALKHKIDFQVNLEGDIASITEAISEQDLGTLIADLGENAIIATIASEIKNVLLSIERRTDCYVLKIYDSGDEFPKEVLENLGKKRCTTHAETGGSGIGLMTTSELVQKYHAKFDISSTEVSPPYTKCVSIILHHTQFLTTVPAK